MNKKKGVILITTIVIILLIAAIVFYFVIFRKGNGAKGNGNLVYVESVKSIENGGSIGESSRFMGVVESQETKKVKKDSTKKISEVYVKEGDVVKKDDPLFAYDTSDMEMTLEQLKLDLQGIQNNIDSDNNTIADLTSQRDASTDTDERANLNSQIISTNASLNEEDYNYSLKELEITRQEESINNAVVYAPMDGVVKNISSVDSANIGENTDSATSSDDAFLTIMASGDYRIKGTIDEQSVGLIMSGTEVIVRSRLDSTKMWKGKVTKIDQEPQQQDSSMSMYGNGDSGVSTSKYNFYVSLDSVDGLMLGQHLYIELDYGQDQLAEGLNIPSYYILQEDGKFFVWKRDKDEKITKAEITVGDYDMERDTYPVLSGLTEDDYIALPMDTIEEGNPTTTNYEDLPQTTEDGVNEDDSMLNEATNTDSIEETGETSVDNGNDTNENESAGE